MDASQPQRPPKRPWRFLIALAVGNAMMLGYFLAPQTVGEQIRRELVTQLRAHYPHLDVRIGSGRIGTNGTLTLQGIELRTVPQRFGQKSLPVLQVGRLEVLGRLELDRLREGKPPIRPNKVIASDVVADLWQGADGRWSAEWLWPPLRMDDEYLRIEIRSGRLRVHRDDRMEQRPLEIDQIDAVLDLLGSPPTPDASSVADGSADPRGETTTRVSSRDGEERSFEFRFEVQAAAPFIDSVTLAGDVSGGRLRVTGQANGVRMDPVVAARLPRGLAERWPDLHRVSLLADLRYEFEGSLGSSKTLLGDPLRGLGIESTAEQAKGDWRFSVDGLVRDGRLEHEWLPQPLERLRGQFALHPGGIDILNASARLGDAELRLSATADSWSSQADWRGKLQADGLLINAALAEKMPGRVGTVWQDLRPQGQLDVDVDWERRAGRWSSWGATRLLGVDVEWADFPYPIAQLTGTVEFDETGARSDGLVGRIGGRSLNVAFDHKEGAASPSNWLELACDGPVTIDASLIAALTERDQPESSLERFVRSLSPGGQIHLAAARWDRDAAGNKRQSIDLKVSGGTLRYEGFPYPLYGVRGQILVQNEITRLIGFQAGNSDNAKILCEGYFLDAAARSEGPAPANSALAERVLATPPSAAVTTPNLANAVGYGDGWRLALRFQARDLPLDEALRAALTPDSRTIWDNLSPTGVLDQAEVTVEHAEAWDEPRILISARQAAKPAIDNRTISLRPVDIPYRIDLVEGAMRYDGDMVWIDSLDGRHDSTRISATGRCQRNESGRWRMDLNILSGSRLHPDTELIGSLPAQVRGGFQRLQLRGPLSARGRVGVWLPDAQYLDPAFDWDMVLQLEGNRIGDVGPVRDLRGEITMRGSQDASSAYAEGLVSIDSMHIGSQQITTIRGPYVIRNGLLLLGDAIPPPDNSPRSSGGSAGANWMTTRGRPLFGKVYGGTASLSGEVLLNDGSFDVLVAIADADVRTLLRELGQADSSVVGKAEGQVRLEGVVGASHLLKGAGSAKLSQANLYQLPFLISVFNLLRVKPSEAVAFTDGTARFSVYGNQVTFNELKLWGDLIALDGSGTMSRSQEVNLSFNTKVSPHNAWSYVTSPFGQDRYTLWTINVSGSLANPQIDRIGMEAVGGTLEKLLPGIAAPNAPSREAAGRSWWPGRWTR